jgi:hypothetical protein
MIKKLAKYLFLAGLKFFEGMPNLRLGAVLRISQHHESISRFQGSVRLVLAFFPTASGLPLKERY